MKNIRFILFILLFVSIFACTDKNNPANKSENKQQYLSKSATHPSSITYLRMKANFTRRVDKGFTIVTLNLRTGAEKEYNNKNYKSSILGRITPHPTINKVITGYQKYAKAPYTIVEIDLDSGEINKVPNIPQQAHLPKYSPDGTKIVYHDAMNADNHARVVIYDIDDEKGEQLPCNGLRCWQPDWHPDGTKIVFVEDKKMIIEYDLINRTQTNRFILKSSQSNLKVIDPKYSPDGATILFLEKTKKKKSLSNYREQDINKLIRLDKNNKTTVVYERKGMTGVEWCPDSQHIIYTAINLKDRNNLNEMHLLKIGKKVPTIITSFDKKHIKGAQYCR